MEFMDEALYVTKPSARAEDLQLENFRVETFFRRALELETSAADSVSNRFELEPTRSVLHRGVASLALRVGDVETAKRYIAAAFEGNPPSAIRQELDEIHNQVMMREALTKRSRKSSAIRTGTSQTLVKETINKYTAQIPIDIRGMVTAFGLALYRESLGQNRGRLERNLRRGGFSGYLIVVNEAYPVEDQRVAAAHELSHYMKDRDRFTDRLVDNRMYSSGLDKRVEEEADRIALYWLVPGKHLARIRKEVGYDNAEELARIFRIPVQEMKIRIGQIRRRIRWSEI
jgi:Zn-dependent peptidase ImmA (M78 family)